MLKPDDESRSVEELQDAESRQFVLVTADEAAGGELPDCSRAGDRFAGTAVSKDVDDAGRLDRVSLSLAVLLFFSPWIMGYTDLALATQAAWIGALVVAIVSAAATFHFSEWEEWVNFLAGVLIVATPWVLHFQRYGDAVAAFACIGVMITTIALSELWEAHHPGYRPI